MSLAVCKTDTKHGKLYWRCEKTLVEKTCEMLLRRKGQWQTVGFGNLYTIPAAGKSVINCVRENKHVKGSIFYIRFLFVTTETSDLKYSVFLNLTQLFKSNESDVFKSIWTRSHDFEHYNSNKILRFSYSNWLRTLHILYLNNSCIYSNSKCLQQLAFSNSYLWSIN